MLFPQSFRVWAVAGLFVAFGAGVAQAQYPFRPGMRPQQAGTPVTLKGTIVAVSGNSVRVMANNVTWVFQMAPTAQITVKGTAELEYLRPRVYVQFTGEAEKETGIVKDPVSKLTIATAPAPQPVAGKTHGKAPDTGLSGLNANTLAPGTIGGHITSIKGNKVTVKPVGHAKPISFEITDTPSIDINVNDINLAGNGDLIDLQGNRFGQGSAGILNSATITLAQPLTGPHKHKPAAKPKKTADEPAANAAK